LTAAASPRSAAFDNSVPAGLMRPRSETTKAAATSAAAISPAMTRRRFIEVASASP
jgi:hypothetical protein